MMMTIAAPTAFGDVFLLPIAGRPAGTQHVK
jgi:hypothetical protein